MPFKTHEEFTSPFTGVTVKIPLTPQGWELYGKRGAVIAAREIAKEMKRAIIAPERKEAVRIMYEVLMKHEKLGAMDTEPRWHAEDILGKARGGDYSWDI